MFLPRIYQQDATVPERVHVDTERAQRVLAVSSGEMMLIHVLKAQADHEIDVASDALVDRRRAR